MDNILRLHHLEQMSIVSVVAVEYFQTDVRSLFTSHYINKQKGLARMKAVCVEFRKKFSTLKRRKVQSTRAGYTELDPQECINLWIMVRGMCGMSSVAWPRGEWVGLDLPLIFSPSWDQCKNIEKLGFKANNHRFCNSRITMFYWNNFNRQEHNSCRISKQDTQTELVFKLVITKERSRKQKKL